MSTFSERPDSEQAQRLFFANAHLPLGLVEAATLLGYWTMRDAEDRDVPTAAAFGMKRQKEFYLGAILMELALHGRLRMDQTTPLENHAYWYEQRHKQGSWKVLWFFVPPLALFLACLIAFQHAQQQLAVLFLLGFVAYILLMLLLAVVRRETMSWMRFSGRCSQPGKAARPTGGCTLEKLSDQLRSALLLGEAPLPEMVALLLLLTVFTHAFHMPRQLRFPS